ncbi:MAG: LptF/LptG family permease [Phycisphaeraceae bacterium]|nr:LptF/LptG family permease [Phycisphaeraceae bacterium]
MMHLTMIRTAPWTLWRHTTGELWRLLLLTTAVLVTVISFAAAVKPLADGKLGPAEAIRFVLLAMPPMLAYALPFASGFAATLAFHRMAQDNEALAAHAGGVSHGRVLAPAAASGLALAGVLLLLNEWVIPHFLRSMEQVVRQDVTKLMVRSFERGQSVEIGSLMIHADSVVQIDPKTDPRLSEMGATQYLVLGGVVFLDIDKFGEVRDEAVVRRAPIVVVPDEDEHGRRQSLAWVRPEQGSGVRRDETLILFEQLRPFSFVVPSAFEDDPKFLTFGELRRLRSEPDRMSFIRARTRDLAYHLAERATTDAINDSLASQGRVRLERANGEPIVVRAAGIVWDHPERAWRLIPAREGAMVAVEVWRLGPGGEPGGGGVTEITADDAWLATHMGGPRLEDRDLTLRMTLRGFAARGAGAEPGTVGEAPGGQLAERVLDNIRPAQNPLPSLLALDAPRLLAIAGPRVAGERPDPFLIPPTQELKRRLEHLDREITSKQHERWAMATSCFVMVITGAVTALRLRSSLPLTVYLWSFFPALGAVLTISGGQSLVHNTGAPGLLMLWGGVGGLSLYTLGAYRELRKH